MFEPMFKQNPSPGWKECPPSSDKVSTSPGKARRREGDAAGEGKGFRRSRDFLSFASKTKKEEPLRCVLSEGSTLFRPRCYDCRSLSSFRPLAYWDSSLRALPAH